MVVLSAANAGRAEHDRVGGVVFDLVVVSVFRRGRDSGHRSSRGPKRAPKDDRIQPKISGQSTVSFW